MFTRPTEADRDRRRTDLVARAGLVRAHGWEDYRAVWSTGEVVAVAALLGDHAVLDELGETLQSVWDRWAFELWGITDGQADVDAGCRQTRAVQRRWETYQIWQVNAHNFVRAVTKARERHSSPQSGP